MSRRSWGSVKPTSEGRHTARYTGPDGKRYRVPGSFPDELSALGGLAEVRKSIDLGAWKPPTAEPARQAPTVGEICQRWLSQCEQQVKTGEMRVTSLQTYQGIMNNRVLNHDGLCSTPVDKLTPREVAHWWEDTVTGYPGTPNRNKRAYAKLRGAIALAVEFGWLDQNPVEIRAARRLPVTKRKKLPTTAELSMILEQTPERFKLGVCLCLFHGLRVGEMLALRRKHFESTPDGGLGVRVEGTLARVTVDGRTTMQWQPPKTEAGHRVVPVLGEFLPLVREHLQVFTTGTEDYATTTATGRTVMDTSFRSAFHRAKNRAGASEEITPHYGRNWLITRLAEAGATPKEIGAVLGQEDVSTIVGVYMRVREHRPAELMKRVKPED